MQHETADTPLQQAKETAWSLMGKLYCFLIDSRQSDFETTFFVPVSLKVDKTSGRCTQAFNV